MTASGPDRGNAFTLGADPEAAESTRAFLDAAIANLSEHSRIEVDTAHVRVEVGEPPSFRIAIPRAAIATAERVPDRPAGTSLGVHGRRGKWLVNAAYTGLVRVTLSRPVRAELRVRAAIPDGVPNQVPWFLRPLLRDRSPRVRELTLSVDDPDAFVIALRSG